MLATTTRTAAMFHARSVQRYLVTGVVWAVQRPKGAFAGARIEVAVNLAVTLRIRQDTAPEVIRAQVLVAAAWIVAPDGDDWEWEGRPQITPLGGAR